MCCLPTIGIFNGFHKDSFGEHAELIIGSDVIGLPNLITINGKLKRAEIGNKVKVVSLGEKKSNNTGRIYFDFDVFIKKLE